MRVFLFAANALAALFLLTAFSVYNESVPVSSTITETNPEPKVLVYRVNYQVAVYRLNYLSSEERIVSDQEAEVNEDPGLLVEAAVETKNEEKASTEEVLVVEPEPIVAAVSPVHSYTPNTTEERFVEEFAASASEVEEKYGIPASVVLAVAIHESAWGLSRLAKEGNNFFGIKSMNGEQGSAGIIYMNTQEWEGGRFVTVQAPFRKYEKPVDSFLDYARILMTKRYDTAYQVRGDPDEFIRNVQRAGYATDPGYSEKVIHFMNKWGLYQLNAKNR